jgi:hypothetical protein
MNKPLRMVFLIAISISLSGCYTFTPAGKLTDNDFVSKAVDLTVSESLNNLLRGLRRCGPFTNAGLIFVTNHGAPVCIPIQPDGSTLCDLYLGGVPYGAVLGRIDLSQAPSGTSAILRVQTYVARKEHILKAWEMFLKGQEKEVCPDN